jgi:hypothetical protein
MTRKSDPPPPGPKHAAVHAAVLPWHDPAAQNDARIAAASALAEERLERQAADNAKVVPAQKMRSVKAGKRRQRNEEIVKKIVADFRGRNATCAQMTIPKVAKYILKEVNAELPTKEQFRNRRPIEDIIRRLEL